MNKILVIFLFIIWLLGCKKSTPAVTPKDPCFVGLNSPDQSAYLFVKEVDDTTGRRKMDKNIYLNEVVGSWKFVCSKRLEIKQVCYTYYLADGVRNITFNFKADFTYTYTVSDSLMFLYSPKTLSGKGKLDSVLFNSSYPSSDLDLGFAPPKGDKMFMNFRSLYYNESYFKKL
jgi:hypothetical protein